jgi:NAD(P)-dependent dehydrogenase (short-subunit alcohol dehydrogenase family)
VTRLAGKRCLVTGGSRGLGRAIALGLARAGANVAITYRRRTADAEETAALLRDLGAEVLVLQGDVADGKHAAAAVGAVVGAWGGIDVLVNCAGTMTVLPMALLEEEDWSETIATHLTGAYLFSRAALRTMIRQKSGSILCVGTFSSERIVEVPVHYAAAKAGLRGFTEALAREVGRHGIRVNLVAPGVLDTGLSRSLLPHRVKEYVAESALGRVGRAEEIAEACVFLASDDASFVTGAKLVLDGGV